MLELEENYWDKRSSLLYFDFSFDYEKWEQMIFLDSFFIIDKDRTVRRVMKE
ncbi:hypothetical protein SORDD17_00739 [Streptococcus oralis]|uniref:Uncharacterized protein n=1 Tax=Streptococcus oralis TaxID=1303 RepID=A0A139RMW9_STROR|nr:hypothetical protein SORDD17_00739 [Streptococcus oralis]